MIEIEKIVCKHKREIEFPESPELDCEFCAMELIDLGPCHGCVYLDKGLKEERWCALWGMEIKNKYRTGVEHCSAREQR